MKIYVVKRNNKYYEVKASGFVPKGAVGLLPYNDLEGSYEDTAWIQEESIQQEDGSFKNTITVNQALKDQILSARAQEQVQREQQKEAENQRINVIRNKIHNFDPSKIKDLASIKQHLVGIITYLAEIDARIKWREED